ncbi:MAG TPA: sigma-70 family RNA polymerase sigma factor [Thermoanaerobaculia bacterium]|nr:sigma-70 family RNA polymerase sigma factor [Thermoanaerobaculia bacterium]
MDSGDRFLENLAVIERAIRVVCAHASLRGADAEDFASIAKLALLEDDCAILRKWEGRSSFATYVTIVIRRLLVDHMRAGGRWYASAAAARRGEAAVLLERLVARDHTSVDDAVTMVRAVHPEVSAPELVAIAAELPERAPRPRLVPMEDETAEKVAARDAADDRVTHFDASRRAAHASGVVNAAMASMSAEDRVILRLRFAKDRTIADIARALGIAQRPLYRRIESLLATLRRALEREGLDAIAAGDLIGAGCDRLDFQLGEKHEETR